MACVSSRLRLPLAGPAVLPTPHQSARRPARRQECTEDSDDASITQCRDHLVVLLACRGVREAGSAAGSGAAAPDGCVVRSLKGRGRTGLAAQIEHARQDARRGPNTKAALERLGYLHVSHARVTGDAGHYKLAGSRCDCLQASYPGEAAALLLRGHVLHQLHRFKEAEQVARELVGEADRRARLRPAGRRADGAGPARRSRRRLSADDRSEAVLSVLCTRRARALDEGRPRRRAAGDAARDRIGQPARSRNRPRGPGRAWPLRAPGDRLARPPSRGSGAEHEPGLPRRRSSPGRILARGSGRSHRHASAAPRPQPRCPNINGPSPMRCASGGLDDAAAVERELGRDAARARSTHGRALPRDPRRRTRSRRCCSPKQELPCAPTSSRSMRSPGRSPRTGAPRKRGRSSSARARRRHGGRPALPPCRRHRRAGAARDALASRGCTRLLAALDAPALGGTLLLQLTSDSH